MQILKGLKESTIDLLVEAGEDSKRLDMLANLTHSSQLEVLMNAHAHAHLGSTYVQDRCDLLKRLTCSWQARNREDIVKIGSTPELNNFGLGGQ